MIARLAIAYYGLTVLTVCLVLRRCFGSAGSAGPRPWGGCSGVVCSLIVIGVVSSCASGGPVPVFSPDPALAIAAPPAGADGRRLVASQPDKWEVVEREMKVQLEDLPVGGYLLQARVKSRGVVELVGLQEFHVCSGAPLTFDLVVWPRPGKVITPDAYPVLFALSAGEVRCD